MADDVSSRFPFINLEKALGRAEQLFMADRSGKPMLTQTAFEVWEYSPKSSGAFQTVAALKSYGLLEDEGSNEDRRIQLSKEARRYFLDERDDVKVGMLASFALSPPLFRALWEKDGWSQGVPADTVARSHLKLDRNLNDQSARSLLSIFKDNIVFAGLRSNLVNLTPERNRAATDGGSTDEQGSNSSSQAKQDSALKASELRDQEKPIVFDMESVTINTRVHTAEALRDLIDKLRRLEPLMPDENK